MNIPTDKPFFPKDKHRAKFQESVNGNAAETYETVAETRRTTYVSVSGLVTYFCVSVAAVSAETYHFCAMFPSCFSLRKQMFPQAYFMFTLAETLVYVPEILFFHVSADVFRLVTVRKYEVTSRKHSSSLVPDNVCRPNIGLKHQQTLGTFHFPMVPLTC